MKNLRLFALCLMMVVISPSFASIIHVPGDTTTIKGGIALANSGDTVLVAPGIYYEHDIHITKNIILGSYFLTTGDTTFIDSTIVDGNAQGMVFMIDNVLIISGFTIRNGHCYGYAGGIWVRGDINGSPIIAYNIITGNQNIGSGGGGGIETWLGHTVIRNNKIINNHSDEAGGGICVSWYGQATISDNIISNNTAATNGGGIATDVSGLGATITGNTISNNYANTDGGGIVCQDTCGSVIQNNLISDNSSNHYGGGICCNNDASPVIKENYIIGNSAGFGSAIECTYNSNPDITNNIITDNLSIYTIQLISCSPLLRNNTFYNNSCGHVIQCTGADATIINNLLVSNSGTAIYSSASNLTISNNNFYDQPGTLFYGDMPSGIGVLSQTNANGDSCDAYANIFLDPFLADAANGDFQITWANWPVADPTRSPAIDAGDPTSPYDPDNTVADIGALYFHQPGNNISAGYVSGTWTAANSPYLILGDITIHADSTLTIEPGVEVNFQGHYKLCVDGALRALGIAQDSITFTATNTVNAWKGIRIGITAESTILDYCIIEHGVATGAVPDLHGGGIYIRSPHVAITHCRISDNRAYLGGGIYVYSDSTSPTISECIISGNTAEYGGGGIYFQGMQFVLTGCLVEENTSQESDGGGVYCIANIFASIDISGCFFNKNLSFNNGWGAGICIGGHAYGGIIISDCEFTANYCYYHSGGGICLKETNDALITNCTFSHNIGPFYGSGNLDNGGSGVWVNSGNLTISHCTFDHNFATRGGTLFCKSPANIIVESCTFWNNQSWSFHPGDVWLEADATVRNTIISRSTGGIYFGAGTHSVHHSDIYDIDRGYNFIGPSIPSGMGVITGVNANGDSCDAYANIFLDPLLADTTNGDFQITWTNWPVWDATRSPAIDAGDPASPRDPDSTVADMGALYFNQRIPVIAISDSLLDFGKVVIGESADLALTLFNFGMDTLEITAISHSQPVFSHNWISGSSQILPGDSLVITVTFAPADTNLILDTLRIENNDRPVEVLFSGRGETPVGIANPKELPKVYALYPAYPNPFNPSTTFEFDLPRQSFVILKVYNILGQEVRTLISKEMVAGRYKYIWNANNIASGLYLYRLKAGEYNKVRKIVFVR